VGNYQQTGYCLKGYKPQTCFPQGNRQAAQQRHFTTVYFKEWSLQCQELKAKCALEMKASTVPGKQGREAQ
jgi:hypothetical protein